MLIHKRHSFSSPHDSHHTRVCPVAIVHMVAEISGRDCTHVRQFLQFQRILLWVFHVLKQWGKCLSCSSCHALVMHLSDLALPHCTPLVCQLHRVKISALCSQRFRLQASHMDATARWRTDRQTDRLTYA